MSGELLIEIGCEELPVWAFRQTVKHLQEHFPLLLQNQRLSFRNFQVLGTPRRLVITAEGLPVRQEDSTESAQGPSWKSAWDADGNPTKAAIGFASRCGVKIEELQKIRTPKGEYIGIQKVVTGKDTCLILSQEVPGLLGKISFPRPMYWSEDRFVFIRPIRWILGLLDDKVIPLQIADVRSDSYTFGHRILGSPAIPVPCVAHYFPVLEENHVIPDQQKRRSLIEKQLQEKAGQMGGWMIPDTELLDEVCGLNEHPHIIAGSFRSDFLTLPSEVLTTVMRKHQKYFSVEDADGRLLPCFLAVTDCLGDPQGIIRRGHERVLEARLNDASFFWKVDTEKTLESRLPMLERCLFHVKLGSYLEKSGRIESIASEFALGLAEEETMIQKIQLASRLIKTDLATDMVKELSELQGIMGGIYARKEGYPEEIWQAIYDQYQPRSLDDSTPRNMLGAFLSLADRMDTLAGCFGVGITPKGSSDPFALRRQAQGVIKILWDHHLTFTIGKMIDSALAAVGPKITRPSEDTRDDLAQFFEQRVRNMLQQRGLSYDVVNAAMARGFEPPLETLFRAEALQRIRQETDFLEIATAFKRVKNILKDVDLSKLPELEPLLFREDSEKELASSLSSTFPLVMQEMNQKNYYQALRGIAALRPIIHRFFDKVLVMAEEDEVRANRLALLRELSALFLLVGDLSEIVVEGDPLKV